MQSIELGNIKYELEVGVGYFLHAGWGPCLLPN